MDDILINWLYGSDYSLQGDSVTCSKSMVRNLLSENAALKSTLATIQKLCNSGRDLSRHALYVLHPELDSFIDKVEDALDEHDGN